jgi:hypothetical protein
MILHTQSRAYEESRPRGVSLVKSKIRKCPVAMLGMAGGGNALNWLIFGMCIVVPTSGAGSGRSSGR